MIFIKNPEDYILKISSDELDWAGYKPETLVPIWEPGEVFLAGRDALEKKIDKLMPQHINKDTDLDVTYRATNDRKRFQVSFFNRQKEKRVTWDIELIKVQGLRERLGAS
jgi:hypothetical protein